MIYNLVEIYPDNLLNPNDNEVKNVEEYYLIETNTDKLYIKMKSLNANEIELLNLLTLERGSEYLAKKPFEKLLLNGVVDESISVKNIRLVYLRTNHLEKNNFTIWKKTLMDSLTGIVDVIFIESSLIVAILNTKKTEKNLQARFSEVIQSLDQDFNLLTLGMIGQLANVNPQTKEIFEYEKNVFKKVINSYKMDGIIMLSNLLIHNIGMDFKKSTIQLPTLFSYLYEEKEIQLLIYHLFENQGNLSQAANVLYLHRNTLSYRIDQFYKKTGFDLTYLPDLVICYLLIV